MRLAKSVWDWIKKHYQVDGLNWRALIIVILFFAVLRIADKCVAPYEEIVATKASNFFSKIWDWLLLALLFPITINPLIIIFGLLLVIPFYHLLNKRYWSTRTGKEIFHEDFINSPFAWRGPYWGGAGKYKATVSSENGYLIFSASNSDWPYQNNENGACLDIRHGVYQGFEYQVTCLVKSDPNTTMGFKLWVHDTRGGEGMSKTNPEKSFDVPPHEEPKEYSVIYTATDTNALRVHLHCKAGVGRILVKEVKIVKL